MDDWLLYGLPAVVIVGLLLLGLLYGRFVQPHLRPTWVHGSPRP